MIGIEDGPLCVWCVRELSSPASVAQVEGGTEERLTGGHRALDQALELTEGGALTLRINNASGCRIFANAMLRGSTVCVGHFWLADNDRYGRI